MFERRLFYIALHLISLVLLCSCLQKSRLKSLESLRKPKSRSIVVASDVAARGLDIPSVATVIHYDCARAVDTFIHRAGRTAVRRFLLFVFLLLSCDKSDGGDDSIGLESLTFTCGVVAASVESIPWLSESSDLFSSCLVCGPYVCLVTAFSIQRLI